MKKVANSTPRAGLLASPHSATMIALGGIGGCIAIGVIAFLAESSGHPLILGSFGASCVLLFGFPESPFSRPINVIGGHCIATFIGLAFFMLCGFHWWSVALASGSAISVMMLTNTVHPPAGSNPVIVMLSGAHWPFLLEPTLIGALLLVVIARFFAFAKKAALAGKKA